MKNETFVDVHRKVLAEKQVGLLYVPSLCMVVCFRDRRTACGRLIRGMVWLKQFLVSMSCNFIVISHTHLQCVESY